MKKALTVLACAGLAACATAPKPAPSIAPVVQAPRAVAGARDCSWYRPAEEDTSKRGDYVAGGLYRPDEKDRVPSAIPDIDCIPEPQVVSLPRSRIGNKPVYSVLDREYRVLDDTHGFVEEGLASYYGEKFHGRRTSNLEVYDMYAFSAAHKTLPIPSFARVTSLDSGKSVVVRVNDRGPFHDGRVMDLSLAAAVKLGIYPRGTGHVRVEALQPGDAAAGTTFARAASTPASPVLASAVREVAPPPPNALDHWVAALPAAPQPALVASTDAASTPDASVATTIAASNDTIRTEALPAPIPVTDLRAANARRYEMRAGDPNATAAHFDGWMRENGVRIATGKPAPIQRSDAATPSRIGSPPATVDARIDSARQDGATRTDADARDASADWSGVRAVAGDGIVLQVASFSARDNADRALATLHGAGIAQARLFDGVAKGQPIWRLRVGPVAANSEAELAAKLRGLGFAAPQRVRD